jgi:hypothetical protein
MLSEGSLAGGDGRWIREIDSEGAEGTVQRGLDSGQMPVQDLLVGRLRNSARRGVSVGRGIGRQRNGGGQPCLQRIHVGDHPDHLTKIVADARMGAFRSQHRADHLLRCLFGEVRRVAISGSGEQTCAFEVFPRVRR